MVSLFECFNCVFVYVYKHTQLSYIVKMVCNYLLIAQCFQKEIRGKHCL